MKKTLTMLILCMSMGIAGCGTVAALLPDVIAYVQDGAQILDVIETFIQQYFFQHPNPDTQAQIEEAISKARTALVVALRTAQGAKDLNDQQVDAAFQAFKDAYLNLLVLVKPYGVTVATDSNGAPHMTYTAARIGTPATLTVPMPLMFTPKHH